MSGLEKRSGPKILLKLILDKTFDILEQSVTNENAIEDLIRKTESMNKDIKILIAHAELTTDNVIREDEIE